jgi:hypothetical protein
MTEMPTPPDDLPQALPDPSRRGKLPFEERPPWHAGAHD